MLVYSEGGRHHDITGRAMGAPQQGEPVADAGRFSAEQLYSAVRAASLDCTFLYSRRHGIIEFSSFAQDKFGMPGSIVAPTVEKVVAMIPVLSSDKEALQHTLRSGFDAHRRAIATEIRLRAPGGGANWVAVRFRCMYAPDGALDIASGSFFSIQNVLAYNHYTNDEAMLDPVTLLPNRKKLVQDVRVLLQAGGAGGHLVMLDITNFKFINGTFSYEMGDLALQHAGGLLRRIVADEGGVYHCAADQFAVFDERHVIPP